MIGGDDYEFIILSAIMAIAILLISVGLLKWI